MGWNETKENGNMGMAVDPEDSGDPSAKEKVKVAAEDEER
jgi:hypothetical protein